MKKKLVIFDLDNTILKGDSDYSWINFLIEEGHVDQKEYESRNKYFMINIMKENLIMMNGPSLPFQQ